MESNAMTPQERRSLIGFAKLYVLEQKTPEPGSPAAEPEAETTAQAAVPSEQISDADTGAIAATQS